MSDFNWCHGPECHKKHTVDRVRGVKGSKVLRTRKVKISNYGDPNMSWNWFCSNNCERNFWDKYGIIIHITCSRICWLSPYLPLGKDLPLTQIEMGGQPAAKGLRL